MKKYLKTTLIFIVLGVIIFHQTGRASAPKRIVSLDLCTDWMLLKYASRSQVLAFSPLLYKYRVDWVPDGLPVHDGTLEQLLQLAPDLVLTGEYNAIILRKRLRQLGMKIDIMPLPVSLKSIQQYEQHFHNVVNKNSEVSTSIQQFAIKDRRMLLLGANGIGTGTDTLESDIIVKSGWTNYVQRKGYVNLDLEQLVSDPPDAVLWAAPVSNSLANLFSQHTVLSKLMDKQRWLSSDYWRWQCPGPWTYDLIRELAEWESY